MKTKNILKIGVLSILLFVLLFSPILKSNILQVKAESECEEQEGICISPRATSCNALQGDYIESSLSCVDAGGKIQCCIENPEPGISQVGQHGLHTVSIPLKEKPTDEICGEWPSSLVPFADINWWEHLGCVIQKGILEGLGKMFAAIITSQTTLIMWAFDPATYGGFVNNDAVQSIWGVMRDLINLILILVLVIIAIATILGYKKYAWKQILWKLIIVALLINFSLVIAGTVLDVSNFLAYNFLNAAKMNNDNLAQSMISSFEIEKLSGPEKYEITPNPDGKQDTQTGWGMSWGNFLIAFFSLVLIGLFALIALLAIFVAMIVRSFMLIALLSVSPVAFAAWIFPDTVKYWKMWWDQFIKWCTFPIIFGLMLYIGIFAVNNLGITSGDTELGMIPFIIRIFLFSMFLIGGLIFSLQGGGALSQIVMKQSSKLGVAAGAFVSHKALKGAAGSETWRKAQKKLEGSKFAPTHDIGVWMGRQPGKIRAAELKQIAEDYKEGSPDQIRTDMESHKNDRRRVALGINSIAEQGELDYEKDTEFIKAARNQSNLNVSGIKKNHLELYTEYFTKPGDMQNEITKVQSKYPGITKEQVKNRVTTNLMADQVIKSSPDNIKSGNWANISDRLEKKGETEEFFGELLDRDLKAEKLAAMINSIDDSDKQTGFINRIRKLMMKKLNTNDHNDVINYCKLRGYHKNPVLRAAFNL